MPPIPPPATIAGFPYIEVGFTKAGAPRAGSREALLGAASNMTDLLVLAHGWNETAASARNLYAMVLTEVRAALADGQPPSEDRRVGVVGVQWPSMILTDGLATGVSQWRTSIGAALPRRFDATIQELCDLVEARPSDPDAVDRYMALLARLGTAVPGARRDEDGDGAIATSADPMFDLQALVEPSAAAGLGDVFDRVWHGAREALRATTFWQMKRRAGETGTRGLGPLLAELAATRPNVRVHLVGHSFGARLVASALPSLGPTSSTVDSMALLQGGFSHFAFAASLPHDAGRSGQLVGMEGRVRGQVVATHTRFDTALSTLYPLAARMSGDDAAGTEARASRFGALGADGAHASNEVATKLLRSGAAYAFTPRRIVNVDGNAVMTRGGPPDGAHSDLSHREIGWLIEIGRAHV